MSSDDSDDEPLSVIAASKNINSGASIESTTENEEVKTIKKRKKKVPPVITKLPRRAKRVLTPPIIERPADVWLYLKDLKPTGPYNCLLCPEWFINKSKIIIHYVLNHKKDFCGICRYFVPDRDAWWAHMKFHTPWPCSQCVENFDTETTLRHHLSCTHKLVHCRLCHFRVPDDDQYNTHLFQKHNVTNVSSKDEEIFWEQDYEGSTKFLCLLCSKSNNISRTFFNHYMGYHHFTLKCFTRIICGRDPPFTVIGAEVSTEFVDGLKESPRFGYVDLDQKQPEGDQESNHSTNNETNTFLDVLVPEVKTESTSDPDEPKHDDTTKNDENDVTKTYKGDEDFDVTLMELILMQLSYFDYISQTLTHINSHTVPQNSDIVYEDVDSDLKVDLYCSLCQTKYETLQTFSVHMNKMHCVKSVPIFSCRVCATSFDSRSELDTHTLQEMKEFDDLWLCQFCDKEFDNRESTREHLTEHYDDMEFDNCFSPHLGFKCKYCPTLFWNETDRQTHQVRVHFSKHKEQYYKCESCNEIYSDKVWYIHHYLEKHHEENDKIPLYLLKCCLCCLVMETVEEMRDHFKSHHPEAMKVFCSLDSCKYKPLSHRKSFKMHLRLIHNPSARSDRSVTCTVCGREFTSLRACSAHMAQVHVPGKFKCKLCRETLQTMDERKLHYLIQHPGRHPFECTECGKSFQYKSSLYMHKQDHVPNKQSYTCSFCGKVFKKKDSFREHMQIHEGPRHACSYCPMRFVQRSNMLRHERRHTGERPYACPHCPRTFADKGACTSHSRTHSKETSYACLYCGQTFVQKSKLTYHIRKHTGENLETCSICSKLFTSACSLREHMKTHNDKKQVVKCPMCDKKYSDERYMLRHLRTSHTRRHHPCPLCRKSLSSAAALRHHVITHCKQDTFRCKMCPKTYADKRTIVKHLRRRHSLNGTDINLKDFYTRLDPRECELGLSEDVMTTIFGPPKKTANDVLVGDFVTLTKEIELPENKEKKEKKETTEEVSKESEEENEYQVLTVCIKQERKDEENNEELEPTDFVTVKIEPTDDDEMA